MRPSQLTTRIEVYFKKNNKKANGSKKNNVTYCKSDFYLVTNTLEGNVWRFRAQEYLTV